MERAPARGSFEDRPLMRLLDNRYAPITSEIGFLECPSSKAAGAFQDWESPLLAERGMRLNRREVAGDLPARIEHLLPLTSGEARRYLFLPTASTWTAYLDNGSNGTDVFSAVSFLATRIGCRGLRAVSVPHTIRKTPTGELGRYGATILEVYSPDSTGCHFLNIRRSISAANDGGRWRFDANGETLPFERLEWYKARQIRDRFTPEMLDEYLQNFGIQLFSPDFYNVQEPGYLIGKEGPCPVGSKTFSLEDVRASF